MIPSCQFINNLLISKSMETRTPPSFFEISINTDKFSQFTASLNAILATHEKQLQCHTRELAQIRMQTD